MTTWIVSAQTVGTLGVRSFEITTQAPTKGTAVEGILYMECMHCLWTVRLPVVAYLGASGEPEMISAKRLTVA